MSDSRDDYDVPHRVVLIQREVAGAPLEHDELTESLSRGPPHLRGVFEHTQAAKNAAYDFASVKVGCPSELANPLEVLVGLDRQLNHRHRIFLSGGAGFPATFARRCFSMLSRSYA